VDICEIARAPSRLRRPDDREAPLRPRSTRGPDHGFTLLELVVVLAVIGVMIMLTAGYYVKWADFHRFSSATATLDSVFRTVRLRAIGRQMTLPLVFMPMRPADLTAQGWGSAPYPAERYVFRYPYRATPASNADYTWAAFIYDPDVYTITVNTGSGIAAAGQVGDAVVLDTATVPWQRTVAFNSRGFLVRNTRAPLFQNASDMTVPYDPNNPDVNKRYDWTQQPFRFSMAAAELRTQEIIFTVSPVGRITREGGQTTTP